MKWAPQLPPNGGLNPQSDTTPISMCTDRSPGTWQISGEVLDYLVSDKSGRVNGHGTFYCSLLIYFMLSSGLFSFEQGTNLFHQWHSCWPCLLVYLQPPLSFTSHEVIASWGETWENNAASDRSQWGNYLNNCWEDLTFVIRSREKALPLRDANCF